MTEERLKRLADIYNELLRIQTVGESSFIYTDCMRALRATIMEMQEDYKAGQDTPVLKEE